MQANWSKKYRQCTKFIHILVLGLCFASIAQAQPWRAPANYVPDDDMIVVPIYIDRTFIDKVNEDNEKSISQSKKKVEQWIKNDEYARAYGLEGTGAFPTTTPAQRRAFFEKTYLRYVSRKLETDTNEGISDWWNEYNQDDEIENIDNRNKEESYVVKATKRKTGINKISKKTSKKVGGKKKKKLNFSSQLRPEIGAVKFGMESFLFDATVWVGANGKNELNVERKFKKIKLRAMGNYYLEENKLLGVLDKKLIPKWSLRYSHEKWLDDRGNYADLETGALRNRPQEDNKLQLQFRMRW